MPADFPKAAYQGVEAHISQHLEGVNAGTVPGFFGYAGGWNGLVIRFRAAAEYASLALPTLATPRSLSNEERYAQERDLLGFFANTVSAVESCCFAVYHLGVMTKSPFFGKPAEEVNVKATAAALSTAFSGSALDTVLSGLKHDATWRRINNIRNILVHRESPGRTVFVGTGSYQSPPAQWTVHGVALDESLVRPNREWLGQTVIQLVRATDDFVRSQFPI